MGNMSQRLQNEKSTVIEMIYYFRFNAANARLGAVLRGKDSWSMTSKKELRVNQKYPAISS